MHAVRRGLFTALGVGLVLAPGLSLVRLFHLWAYVPAFSHAVRTELPAALLMGLRFDLKACAVVAILVWPLFCFGPRLKAWAACLWGGTFALLSVVNFYYYGFYKTPIDSVVFGLIDDDTGAVLNTIWHEFPVGRMVLFLLVALAVACGSTWHVCRMTVRRQRRPPPVWPGVVAILIAVVLLLMAVKGTMKGMALQSAHLTVTSQPVLNHAVPNGAMALYYAWREYANSLDVGSDSSGLKAYGFDRIGDAARVLGLDAQTDGELAAALRAHGVDTPNGKNLVFFQVESWSAEPLRYQSAPFDVLGSLQPKLAGAWRFDNFDSARTGTHPALETILFGTPITPITTGKYLRHPFDWSLPRVLKKAGYDTLFVTSGYSGWRALNRTLPVQGFDEVIDAAVLKRNFPQAEGGIWGVWDAYMMRYISRRLAEQPAGRPLFIYAMTTTNHPPYELPKNYPVPDFQRDAWPGERDSDSLIANLRTYRYTNDQLAGFLDDVDGPLTTGRTIVAATGDHNVRTMGMYATPQRRVLRQQVPFMIWGAGGMSCPAALNQPASHLDMFPTLLPLLGIRSNYLVTGRDLSACPGAGEPEPLALTMIGQVRTSEAIWELGQPGSVSCISGAPGCAWPAASDRQARARLALLDWNIRRDIKSDNLNAPASVQEVPTRSR